MGQVYVVNFTDESESTTVDLFEITPADDRPLEVLGLFIAQISEVGDTEEENIDFQVIRGHTTSGTGGTSQTPQPVDPRGASAGFTAETLNATTLASAGTAVPLHSDAFYVRQGFGLWLPEGCGWKVDQGQTTLVVRLLTAPADAITLTGCMYVKEG